MSSANVVLIGERGQGKTTLINYVENYFRKNSINQLSIPNQSGTVISYESVGNGRNLSPSTYKFIDQSNGQEYVFLDTPGFVDANDEEENQIISNNIIEAILALRTLRNVIFVVNGSNNRLSSFRLVLKFLHNYFSDRILSKLIVVLTNVQQHPSSFDLNWLNFPRQIHVFYMQNNVFVNDPRRSSNETRYEIQRDFQNSFNQIRSLLEVIEQSQSQSTEIFLEIRQMRFEIQQIFHLLRLEIISVLKINSDSSGEQALIETFQCLPNRQMNTICSNCNVVCYGLDRRINGRCSKCPKKCLQKHHYAATNIILSKLQSTHSTFAEIAERFSFRCNLSKFSIDRNGSQTAMAKIVEARCEQIQQKFLQLTQICSFCDLDDEIDEFFDQMATARFRSHSINKKLEHLFNAMKNKQEADRREKIHREILFRTEKIEKKPIDYKQLKNEELVEMISNNVDPLISSSLFTEIFRRIQGHSFYQVVNGQKLKKLNEYFEKYKKKDVTQLTHDYRQYQRRISKILEDDLRNIVRVPEDLLFENYIVSIVLEEKESNNDVKKLKHGIGFESISVSTAPYPSTDAMPSGPNPFYTSILTNVPQQPFDQQENSMNSIASELIKPYPIPQPLINSRIYPDVVTTVTTEITEGNNLPPIIENPLRFFSNQELMLMHSEAVRTSNSEEEMRINQEFNQRCFGDHPILISAHREKFNEFFRRHQEKNFNQLIKEQNSVHSVIENILGDGDATRIERIPIDFILEAASLKQLILSKIRT